MNLAGDLTTFQSFRPFAALYILARLGMAFDLGELLCGFVDLIVLVSYSYSTLESAPTVFNKHKFAPFLVTGGGT